MLKPGVWSFSKKARGCFKRGEMNKTEAAYAQYLELLRQAGEILWFAFEHVRLKIGEGAYFAPDFFVMRADFTLEAHEVKGFMRPDSLVRLKCAAGLFPFVFKLVRQIPKRDGGGWDVTEDLSDHSHSRAKEARKARLGGG